MEARDQIDIEELSVHVGSHARHVLDLCAARLWLRCALCLGVHLREPLLEAALPGGAFVRATDARDDEPVAQDERGGNEQEERDEHDAHERAGREARVPRGARRRGDDARERACAERSAVRRNARL